jgi:dephospho-CoA kinase
MSLIIGITGLARCGKDTVADYLANSFGFKVFTMSDVIKTELMKKNMIITKDNMSKLGDLMRDEFGKNVVAVKTLERAKKFPKVVITGLRSPEEVKFFKYESDKFFLINVFSNDKLRFRRRSQLDPNLPSEFYKRDNRDLKNKGLDEVIKKADYVINNNYSLDNLYKKVDEILKDIVDKSYI